MDGLEVLSFGCRLNIWESEVMRGLAREAGLTQAVIVNTCAVTSEAERQARQAVRRARRRRPEAAVIVTGCAAQLRPDAFAAMPEVTRVLGNAEKLERAAWGSAERVAVGDPAARPAPPRHPATAFARNTRGFVQVQQGCDHRCTFCIIPLARGNSRSVPLGAVAADVRSLVECGHREVVLTGIDLTAWGADLPGRPPLGQLVRRLLKAVPELERLRLSSLDPAEIDDELWQELGREPRLMPHLHLSVQSGDDLVLKRMKRRHGRAQVLAAAARARSLRPDVALGADLIAGFPTETEEQFARTLDLIEEAGLSYLHVFPYSARPGTPAARMPQLPAELVRVRAARLREAGARARGRRLRSRIGRVERVLMERGGTGHTECMAEVRPDRPAAPGAILDVLITGIEGEVLLGEAR